MEDEQSGEQPALAGSRPPAAPQHGAPPTPQGLDWKAFWEDVKNLIRGGTKLGAELEASTQTPADDVLLGKIGIITAPVSIGKAGEIRLPVRGGTQDYIACAQTGFADTIAVNAMAEVVAFVPPNTVYVKPKL
jgi:hypothetical protein